MKTLLSTPRFLFPTAALLIGALSASTQARAQGAPPLDVIFDRPSSTTDALYGAGLACITDFVGSGIQSAAIGSPGFQIGGSSSFEVVNGAGTTVLFSDSRVSNDDSIRMGGSIASIGNAGFNSSGLSDLLVSLDAFFPGISSPSTATVYSTPSGGSSVNLNYTIGSVANVGYRVAGLFSDSNNNGLNDFLLTAPSGGLVLIADRNSLAGPISQITDDPNSGFGESITSVSDLDGDGVRDIIVGAPSPVSFAAGGRIVAVSGLADSGAFLGSYTDDQFEGRFGASVAEVGDLNGDGLSEIVVGAPADNSDGQVPGSFVLLSPSRNPNGSINFNVLCDVAGTTDGDELGYAVAAPGDVNADGVPDFVVSDPGAANGTGIVSVISYDGTACNVLFLLSGSAPGVRFGTSLSTRPSPAVQCDLNGDGGADFGVGQRGLANEGGVTFFAGIAPPTPTPTPTPQANYPTKSAFTYKIAQDGNITATATYNRSVPPLPPVRRRALASACTASLYGRRTRADRSQPGPILTIVKNKPIQGRLVMFRAPGLRRAQCDFGGKPFSYHMIVKTTCGGKSFFSNVVARQTACGKAPPLPIDRWERQLLNLR